MRIALIASHCWPLPSPARGGDSQVLLDLSRSLAEMGHRVDLYAPKGTTAPQGVNLCEMPLPPSRFEAEPSAEKSEEATMERYRHQLQDADVVHDCSVGKSFHRFRTQLDGRALVTIWGGPWRFAHPARNVVAQSHAQRDRLMRGATDYVGTDTPDAGGPPGTPLNDCRVVWNGICTDAPDGYAPTGDAKQDHFLMLGRWHVVRGIEQGIELAKATGINLLIAGTDPEEDHPAQAAYAKRICELVRGCDNISVEFLPMGFEAHHARKVELYSDAKALLFLPLFQEPFGLSQIEAFACGTDVIANGMGSTREINDGTFDMTADQTWLTKEQGWSILGRRSRARAVEMFDRKVMAAAYLKLYEEVAGGGGWG